MLLGYAWVSCASRRTCGKFDRAKGEARLRQRRAALRRVGELSS